MSQSIIYRNIHVYRLVMQILYGFGYRKRFKKVTKLFPLQTKTVSELCFGDIYIAEYCRGNKIEWTGFDINSYFVKRAKKKGFNAIQQDIVKANQISEADVCVMIGSLYHFNDIIESFLIKIINIAPVIIISEPVKNITSNENWIGKLAAFMTNAGKGAETFRFNKDIIIKTMNLYSKKLNFTYSIVSIDRDIIIKIEHVRN